MEIKKLNFLILFLVLILGVIFFSGCSSSQDCSSMDSTYVKYGWNDDLGKCVIVKKIPQNVCGNGVPEEGETYCNCPKDVRKTDPKYGCFGNIGDYVEKACNNKTKKCAFFENNKVVLENKQVLFKSSDLTIQANIKLNNPFVLNTANKEKIQFSLSLFNKKDDSIKIEDVIVNSFSILDGKNTVLANIELNKPLNQVGQTIGPFSLSVADTTGFETKIQLKPQIVISYKKVYYDTSGEVTKSEDKRLILTSSLGTWTFINPNFYSNTKKH
jgi:hypothetical protein